MTRSIPHLRMMLTTVAILHLVLTPVVALGAEPASDQATSETTAPLSKSVNEKAERQLDEKRKQLITEATAALEETEKAIEALKEEDTQKALNALALATGKLELIIARDPELALAPVDVDLTRVDLLADLETINKTRKEIEDFIKGGEIQKARSLLRNFGSEIITSTTNLPLGSYPDAIKLATSKIDDGDIEGAISVLETALAMLVVTRDVTPLPLLRAEALLEKAKAGLQEPTDSDDEAAEAAGSKSPPDLVTQARQELKMAEALGYGGHSAYADLRKNLDELESKIGAEQYTGGIFESIEDKLIKLKERMLGEEIIRAHPLPKNTQP